MKLRSRRLEALLQTSLDSIVAADLARLVEGEVPEAEDLDFKEQNYAGEKGNGDLASDVAAMANTRGGLIIIGIRDVDDRAAELSPIPLAPNERERITQIVAARISPPVEVDVVSIPDPALSETAEGPARGYVVIGVTRSARAPHGTLFGDKLRYSRRVGSHTRHLAEPEIAAAYRSRDLNADHRAHRLSTLRTGAESSVDRQGYPWLVVTSVPELPGDFRVDNDSLVAMHSALIGKDIGSIFPLNASIYRVRVGKQRIWADGESTPSSASRWARFELWADGSSLIATALPSRQRAFPSDPEGDYVRDSAILHSVINALHRAAQHAHLSASAGGDLLIDARLFPSAGSNQLVLTHARDTYWSARSTTTEVPEDLFAESFAPLESLVPFGGPLLAVAIDICTQLGQSLGIADFGYLTRDGEPIADAWETGDLARLMKRFPAVRPE